MSTETLRTDNPHGGLHSEAIGSCVAGQLEVPLVVVDRRLVPAWANGAARSGTGAVWNALLGTAAQAGAGFLLRSQLQELVLQCLRDRARSEALLEGAEGAWFTTAVPLQGHTGLVLLRVAALHHFAAAGVRERLRRLFGLSEAEAQIAVQLACGANLKNIAAARGVSLDTVRTQVRSIFHKTGLHRQGELICVVGRLAAA